MTTDVCRKSRPISGTTEGGNGDMSEHRHVTPGLGAPSCTGQGGETATFQGLSTREALV